MDSKYSAALSIALRANVLACCDIHGDVFYPDADPAPAFELAIAVFHQRSPGVAVFTGAHELTDIVSAVISQAPAFCNQCRETLVRTWGG